MTKERMGDKGGVGEVGFGYRGGRLGKGGG